MNREWIWRAGELISGELPRTVAEGADVGEAARGWCEKLDANDRCDDDVETSTFRFARTADGGAFCSSSS